MAQLSATQVSPFPSFRRTADVVADEIVRAGCDKAFAVPGGPIGPLFDALYDRSEVEVVVSRHETGAVHTACGYALATGQVGVSISTCGPGLTNSLTGLITARQESIPLVHFAGDVPRADHGRTSVQEVGPYGLDLADGYRNAVKMAIEVTHPSLAKVAIRRAFAVAREGRPGPVLVILPLDVSSAPPEIVEPLIARKPVVDEASGNWEEIVRGLVSAEKPMLFVGSGVRVSGTGAEVLKLAESLRVPFATTAHAKGTLPETHPLSLGVHGHARSRWAAAYAEEGPDYVVALGTQLSDLATGGYRPLARKGGTVIQVDIDPTSFGKTTIPVTATIQADLRSALPRLLEAAEDVAPRAANPGLDRAKAGPRVERPEDLESDAVPLSPARALADIERSLPENAKLVADIGEHGIFALHYFEVKRPGHFYKPVASCTMATGLTLSLGMAIGDPETPIVCLTGDGCMGMHGLELVTATTLGIPLTIAVFNDSSYGMVKFGNQRVFGRSNPFEVRDVDFAKLAESIGAIGVTVTRPGEIDRALLELAQKEKRPVVIDVKIDRTIASPGNNRVNQMAAAGTHRSI